VSKLKRQIYYRCNEFHGSLSPSP